MFLYPYKLFLRVLVFEDSDLICMSGATLGKGLNRGIGTLLGGGLGCLVAILADEVDRVSNAVIVGTSVFLFGKHSHNPLASYSFKFGVSDHMTRVAKVSTRSFFLIV